MFIMVNDKQFLLARFPYIKDGWKNETLKSGWILSWQNKLPVVFNSDKSIALLGWAFECRNEKPQPSLYVNCIATCAGGTQDIIDAEKTWCGRYLLNVGEEIYLDATGMLNTFYSEDMVSSSLNVMCEVKHLK